MKAENVVKNLKTIKQILNENNLDPTGKLTRALKQAKKDVESYEALREEEELDR